MNTARIIAVALLLTATSYASAGTDKTALLISGTAAVHARELAATAVEAVTRESGRLPTQPTFSAKDVAAIRECVTTPHAWRCVAPVIHDKELRQLAIVSLVNDIAPDHGPMIVVTEQVIRADLDVAVAGQRFCVRCTDDVLINMTTELTRTLFQEIEVRSGRTVIAVKSVPRGARITFDGNSMGATNRSFNTFPGRHTVVLDLDGYRRESRTIEASLDRTSELVVTMRSPAAAVAERHDSEAREPSLLAPGAPPTSPLAPQLAMGAGALAVVAGAVLIALNEHPTDQPIGTVQPRYYYDTMPPGIGLVISGAVAGVGGYLWWRYTRSTVAPTVAATPGGGAIGITKAF